MSGSGVLDDVEDGGLLGVRLNGDLRPVAGRNFYNKTIKWENLDYVDKLNYRTTHIIISEKLEVDISIFLTVNSKFMGFSFPSFFFLTTCERKKTLSLDKLFKVPCPLFPNKKG
jgi:hypothetical protein